MAESTVSIAIEMLGVPQADAAVKVVKRGLDELGQGSVGAENGVKTVKRSLDDLGKSAAGATTPLQNIYSAFDKLGYSLSNLQELAIKAASGLALIKLAELGKDAVLLSARYETLGVVMGVIGQNSGYVATQMAEFQAGLQKTGISAIEARQGLALMGQAQIDFANSEKLARIAQNAAVVGNINSSEAFNRMITGLATGQSILLHHLGLMTNFESAYTNAAHAAGKTAADLTATEKAAIRVNEVIRAGAGISGAYEAAMGTVGKQLTSLPRYFNDLMVAVGSMGQGAMFTAISSLTDALKWLLKNVEDVITVIKVALGLGALAALGKMLDMLLVLNAANKANTAATIAAAEAEVVRTAEVKLAAVAEAAMTGSQAVATEATLAHALATEELVVVQTAATLRAELMAVATTGLNVAMGLVGGWIGLMVIAIGGAIIAWNKLSEAEAEHDKNLAKLAEGSAFGKMIAKLKETKELADKLEKENKTPAEQAKSAQDKTQSDINAAIKENIALKVTQKKLQDEADSTIYGRSATGKVTELETVNSKIAANNSLIKEGVSLTDQQIAEESRVRAARKTDTEPAKVGKDTREKELSEFKKYNDARLGSLAAYQDRVNALTKQQSQMELAAMKAQHDQGLISEVEYLRADAAEKNREADAEAMVLGGKYAAQYAEMEKIRAESQKKGLGGADGRNTTQYSEELKKTEESLKAYQLAYGKIAETAAAGENAIAKQFHDADLEVKKYRQSLAELSMTEAERAQSKIDDTHRPALKKALEMQDAAVTPAELAMAADYVKVVINLAQAEKGRAAQQQLFAQQEAQIGLLQAQGATEYARQLQQQLDLDKAVAAGKDPLVIAMMKQVNAINDLKAAQDRANSLTDMTSSTAIMNESDPYKKKLLQMDAAYQKEIKATKDQQKKLLDIQSAGGNAYLKDKTNIDAEIAASSDWLTAKDLENHDNVTKAKMTMAADYFSFAGQALSDLASTQDQSSRQGFETAKAMNIGAAIMSTAAAIIGQLAGPDAWTPVAWARAAMAGVMGAVQIAKIASTTFKGGGSASSAGASGSWGGTGGAASTTGSGISAPTTAIRDSQSQADLTRIAGSMENASIALVKVADGLTKIATLFESGTGKYLGGALSSASIDNSGGGVPLANGNGFWSSTGSGAAVGATIGSILGPMGTVVGGVIGAVVGSTMNALFGTGNSWYTKNSGLSMGISGGALTNQAYLNEQKDGGWFTGNKTRTSYVDANPQVTAAINSYLSQITAQVTRSAAVMGTTADLGSATLAATQIQTSGRSAADIQKDLEAWLTTAAATFAGTIKNLDQYIFPGEDKFTGLIRLATSLQGVNIELATIGGTLIESSMKGADAAYNLASAFGGLDKLQSAVATYQKAMFTDTEQAAMKAKGAGLQVTAAFAEMGVAVPVTKDAFKSLVNSLDLTTDRGRALFAALMNVSDSFATVIDQATKLAKTLSDSKQDLAVRTLNANGNTAQGSLQKLAFDQEQERLDYTAKGLDLTQLLVVQQLEWNKAIVDTTTAMRDQDTELKARKDTLSNMLQGALSVTDTLLNLRTKDSSLSADQQLAAAHDLYQNTLTSAKSTDTAVSAPAMNNLGSMAQAYIDLAKSSYVVNSQAYLGIYGAVTGGARAIAAKRSAPTTSRRTA